MPCSSEHLQSTELEKELHKVYDLLDEAYGKGAPKENFGNGYREGVYNSASKERLDKKTAELCAWCQGQPDITKYSLELQIWWRDHQRADKKRLEQALMAIKTKLAKAKAIAKLTAYERKLLNL